MEHHLNLNSFMTRKVGKEGRQEVEEGYRTTEF